MSKLPVTASLYSVNKPSIFWLDLTLSATVGFGGVAGAFLTESAGFSVTCFLSCAVALNVRKAARGSNHRCFFIGINLFFNGDEAIMSFNLLCLVCVNS
ncbi:hypothetical protein D9M68_649340 [compost metagenome]